MITHLIPVLGNSQQNINEKYKVSHLVNNKPFVKTNGKYSDYRGRYYEKKRTASFYRKYTSRELTQKHRGKTKQLLITMWWKLIQASDMEHGVQFTIEQWRVFAGERITARHIKEMIGRFIAREEIFVRDPKRTSRHLNSVPYYSVGKDSPYFSFLEKVKQSIPDPRTISKKVFTQLLLNICDIKLIRQPSRNRQSTSLRQSTLKGATTKPVTCTHTCARDVDTSKNIFSQKKEMKIKGKGEAMSYVLKNISLNRDEEAKILHFSQEALTWADAEMPKTRSNQLPFDKFYGLCRFWYVDRHLKVPTAPTFKDPTTVNAKKGVHHSPNKNTQSFLHAKTVHPPRDFTKTPEEIEEARKQLPHSIATLLRKGWDPLMCIGMAMNAPDVGNIPFLLIDAGYPDLALKVVDALCKKDRISAQQTEEAIALATAKMEAVLNETMDSGSKKNIEITTGLEIKKIPEPETVSYQPINEQFLHPKFEKHMHDDYRRNEHSEDSKYDPNVFEGDDTIPLDILAEFNRQGKVDW